MAYPYLIKNSKGFLWYQGRVSEVQNHKKIKHSCYICECFILVITIKVKIKMSVIYRWWNTFNIPRYRSLRHEDCDFGAV